MTLHRVLEIGVEQDDRQPSVASVCASRSVSRTSRLTSRAISRTALSRSPRRRGVRGRRLDEHAASGSSASARPASARCSARSRTLRESARGSPRRGMDRRPSRRLVQLRFLDLVEQRLVADAEDLRRFAAVPARLLQRAVDQLALGFARGVPGDVLQRPEQAGAGGGAPARDGGGRRCRRAAPARRGRRRRRGCSAGIGPGEPPMRPAIASASSRRIESSDPRMTTRLIRFSSSRTLPGHSYSANSRSVSLASASGGLL